MRDLTGEYFGILTVDRLEYRKGGTGRNYAGYICSCKCGNRVWVRKEDLTHGKQRSCGRACTWGEYTTAEDYLGNTEVNGNCREWLGPSTTQGYGRIGTSPNCLYIHREVFRLTNGYSPEVVMHTCDNRKCINPAHLEGGSHKENFDDMRSKRRQAYGERVGIAKLTTEAVREMRMLYSEGATVSSLSRKYGVARATVKSVCNNKTWRHV